MNFLYVNILYMICYLHATLENENYIFKSPDGNYLGVCRWLHCRYVSKISDYHICTIPSYGKSTKELRSILPPRFNVTHIYKDKKHRRVIRSFNDPDISRQYYIGRKDGLISHNIESVWNMEIKGKGSTIGIVDTGVEGTHVDLSANYRVDLSYNFVIKKKANTIITNSHGTRCAGLVSAVADNKICGAGISPLSKFGSLQIATGSEFSFGESDEGLLFGYQNQIYDIYVASWGPTDNGEDIGKPGELAIFNLNKAYVEGRHGKGNLFVFAGGNGGAQNDNCAFDGYSQMKEIFGIAAIGDDGKVPYYGENCTSILAAALSNRGSSLVYTTDLNNNCGNVFSGTSAAAPIAAGIFSLLISEDPSLTPRQIIYLVTKTSIQMDKAAIKNAAGVLYSYCFGFGVLDAFNLAIKVRNQEAKDLPPEHKCETINSIVSYTIESGHEKSSYIYTSGCFNTNYCVSNVEQVFLTFSASSSTRNSLSMFLTSPGGTKAQVIKPRLKDTSSGGFIDWTIKIFAFYDEVAFGVWKLQVHSFGRESVLINWKLAIHGNCAFPDRIKLFHTNISNRICSNPLLLSSKVRDDFCDSKVNQPTVSSESDYFSFTETDFNQISDLHNSFKIVDNDTKVDFDYKLRAIIICISVILGTSVLAGTLIGVKYIVERRKKQSHTKDGVYSVNVSL